MSHSLLVIGLFAGLLCGCGSSPSEDAVKPQVMTNPGGKPRNEQEARSADLMKQGGESAKARMAEQAKAMKEAQDKAGIH